MTMTADDLLRISRYVMPVLTPQPSALGFLFGTRHGVDEFCLETHALWQAGMFRHLLVSGGPTGGNPHAEALVIAERLLQLGIPASILILEPAATNTGENVILGRARVAETIGLEHIDSLLVIGKVCAMRRYLMTLARHWPEPRLSAHPVNYFGLPAERWHEHEEFRARVLGEFGKIPGYIEQGFLREIDALGAYPALAKMP